MTASMRVLVVDDDEAIRESMRDLLELEGYTVYVAESGEEALLMYRKTPCPIVLLDVRMPGIDGIETLKRLKVLDGNVRAIMITGVESSDVHQAAMAAGAEAVFRKPLDIAFFLPMLMD